MARGRQTNVAATRWASRITPIFVVLAVGYATYAIPAHLCIDFLYHSQGKVGVAAALLTLYFVFFVLTATTYARTFYSSHYRPALVPFNRERNSRKKRKDARKEKKRRRSSHGHDIEAQPWATLDQNLDSPGLEAFYSRDVFVCEADGRPKWCSECRQWKPDRARHSSDLQRCVRKMDHMCPWVGGMVSESSFNFFMQFTSWCTALLAVCLGTSAYCFALQQQQNMSIDGRTLAILVLSAFFIFFSFSMTVGSARFVFGNTTNIDVLQNTSVGYLAVRVPLDYRGTQELPTVIYPLQPHSDIATPPTRNGNPPLRDQRAMRKFAILRLNPGENPFSLGSWNNFKSVMGNNVIEWLFPIRHSPCCNHDSMVSDYPMGPQFDIVKNRYGISVDLLGNEHR